MSPTSRRNTDKLFFLFTEKKTRPVCLYMTFRWNEYKYHDKESYKLTALGWEVVNTCISLHDALFFLYDSKDFLLVQFFCHQSPFLLPYSLSSKLYMLFSLGLAFILASYTCFYFSNIKLNFTYLSCQISFIISEIIPLYEWLPGVNMRNG